MPSYDVVDGQVVGAPPSVQKSWAEFQGQKAPMSSVGHYRQQANDQARAKGEPAPFGKEPQSQKGRR